MLTRADAAALRAGKWFAGLPPSLAENLLRAAEVVRLRAGAMLFARGDANDGIYGMLDGTLRFGSSTESGREVVFALAQPPQWFGEVSMFGGRRTHDAWAESASRLAFVRRSRMSRLLADEPVLWKYLGQLLCHKLELAFETLESSATERPRVRLAQLLVALSTGYRQRRDGAHLKLNVSQERLGTVLSLSRQTVNTLLGALERDGAILLSRGSIRIVDLDRLGSLRE